MLIDGKQVVAGSIPSSKLATAFTNNLFLRDGSVAITGTVDFGGQRLTNLGTPTSGTDSARLQDLFDRNAKAVVRAATTANITLTGTQTIDTVVLAVGDRVLAKDQTTASANGVYVVASGAWARASDSDAASELSGATYVVAEGAVNSDKVWMQTADNVTVGTTALTFLNVGLQTPQALPTTGNKNMAGSLTSADGQIACATTLAATPKGMVAVYVNGALQWLGLGNKTSDCYFSSDSGSTALSTLVSGATLYWNGSIAGFQIATTDKLTFDYDA